MFLQMFSWKTVQERCNKNDKNHDNYKNNNYNDEANNNHNFNKYENTYGLFIWCLFIIHGILICFFIQHFAFTYFAFTNFIIIYDSNFIIFHDS